MTTYVDLVTSTTGPFEFQTTFDSEMYTVSITWPLYAQRPYMGIYDLTNTLVVLKALVGSPPQQALSDISWDDNGIVTVTSTDPHGYTVGTVVPLAIRGVTPSAYNGWYHCSVISPTEFTYTMSSDPGSMTVSGTYGIDLNLLAGYFTSSVMVYRTSSSQFEIDS